MNEHAAEPRREVYTAIRHVMEDMAKAGVGKNKKNTQQNFEYRGVDDVMDALAPSLAKHGLIIIPHVRERTVTERTRQGGTGWLLHTILRIDYDFICEGDGSVLSVGPIFGEAMDTGDKATNKCMAIAFKYLCVQTFCIPITGADDPDAQTHEVAGAQGGAREQQPPSAVPGPRPPAAPAPASAPPPREIPTGSDGKPRMLRPGGNFGYGRKFADTPWSVMKSSDLEWFRTAERTPANIRERIDIEMAWRDWETSQLDAARQRQRAEDDASIGQSEDIPV
jgi:ERF superfamily protein